MTGEIKVRGAFASSATLVEVEYLFDADIVWVGIPNDAPRIDDTPPITAVQTNARVITCTYENESALPNTWAWGGDTSPESIVGADGRRIEDAGGGITLL